MSVVNKPLVVATITSKEDGVSGILNVLAKKGNFVAVSADGATVNDRDELELANGGDGYFLDRDCVDESFEETYARRSLMDRPEFVSPFKKGVDHAFATRLIEGEFEGDDYLDASLDNSAEAGTKVCFKAGKPAVAGNDDKVVGHVVKQLTPVDDANGRRVLIHFYQ